MLGACQDLRVARKRTRRTRAVDGKGENEHVPSGQADDGVGEAWKDRRIGRTATCVSPHPGTGTGDRTWVQ